MQFAIKGNKVLTPEGARKAVVTIRNGQIEAVLPELPDGFTGDVIDVQDRRFDGGRG